MAYFRCRAARQYLGGASRKEVMVTVPAKYYPLKAQNNNLKSFEDCNQKLLFRLQVYQAHLCRPF